MHSARWSIISPTVSASRDTLETPSQHVASLHLSLNLLKLKILAIPILVDQTAILQDRLETDVTVPVSQRWLDHHLTADLNVLSTLTVHLKLHVSTENAKTPALASVEEMPIAESEIMCQYVPVTKDLSEIHSQAATDQQQPHQDQRL